MNLEQLVNELRYGGPQVRTRAARTMAEVNDPQLIPFLIEGLTDEEPEVRVAIAHALNAYRDPRAAPALIKLVQENNFVVAEAAATTLGLTGDNSAVKPLLDMVERAKRFGPNTIYQHNAITQGIVALGRLKDPRATDLLIKTLRKGYKHSVSDWNLQVRQGAALGLGLLDSPDGTAALVETLSDDESRELRGSIVMALGMLRSPESLRILTANLGYAPFEDQTKAWRRLEGITIALGVRGDRAAVPYLLPLVESPYPEIRIALSESLVRLGETDKGEVLIRLLRDRSADVRVAAAQALGALGIQAAAGPLSAVAVDPDRRVAGAAFNALENLKALPSGGSAASVGYLPAGSEEKKSGGN
jgi:HEAT repeat protein